VKLLWLQMEINWIGTTPVKWLAEVAEDLDFAKVQFMLLLRLSQMTWHQEVKITSEETTTEATSMKAKISLLRCSRNCPKWQVKSYVRNSWKLQVTQSTGESQRRNLPKEIKQWKSSWGLQLINQHKNGEL